MKYLILFITLLASNVMGQYQEATITRTVATNSIFPRQFPSMTIRKMNENEYWIFESLGTNTIFHRQFPTYIVRKQNMSSKNQKWGVYRTISTNTVFVKQFPDRYISDLSNENSSDQVFQKRNINIKNNASFVQTDNKTYNGYTYTKSLKEDKTRSYSPEIPE